MVIDHRIGFVGVSVIEVQVQHDGVVLVVGVDVHAVHPHGLAVNQNGHFTVFFAAFVKNVLHVINDVALRRLLLGWRRVGGPLVVVLDDIGPGTPYHGMGTPGGSLAHNTNMLTRPDDS